MQVVLRTAPQYNRFLGAPSDVRHVRRKLIINRSLVLARLAKNLSIQLITPIVNGRDNDKTTTAARMHFQKAVLFVKPRTALTRDLGQPNGNFRCDGLAIYARSSHCQTSEESAFRSTCKYVLL